MISKDPKFYTKGVLEQNNRILAKTITLIESAHPDHQKLAREVLNELLPHTGQAVRLGITGVPGAGKSTFIESFGTLLTGKGHKIAVLAVDPSSSRSGGSILADKTRMEKLSIDPKAFIRPSPAGETLGGVARKTRETMLICEAAGYDVIIIETVGVGQSETTVAQMVDFFLVLQIAGAGDELQGIKKGVLEIADAITINKADGDNVEKAKRARKQYETALHLITPSSPNWSPPVLTCSALEVTGIEEIWQTILKHRDIFKKSGEFDTNRRNQAVNWMWALIEDGLRERFKSNGNIKKVLPKITGLVQKGEQTPASAADELLYMLDDPKPA